ncbi:hypothetical protein M9458_024429, partial [Cirrhinus mrigala]
KTRYETYSMLLRAKQRCGDDDLSVKVRYRELNPAPRFRKATARAKAPPPAHKNHPETATTMAAPAVRARDTATGRPSANESAAAIHRKLAVLER